MRIKKNAAGEIDKYKARLVAKGFTQIYGVNYYEIYALVTRLTSFRLLLALAAQNGWPVNTFDFDSTFLNGELGDDEVVYMELGIDTGNPGVQLGLPVPIPTKTCTWQARVRVFAGMGQGFGG